MNTSSLLDSLETCPKQAALYLSGLEREALTPNQLLWRGVEHGLQVDSPDPPQCANDEVYCLARSRPIETDQTDLIGLCDHIASLAEIIVWILRTGPAWIHPDPLPNWTPSSWEIPGGLRRIVLCDRWDARRALQEVHDWRTLEGAVYGLPMTILAVVIGNTHDGRRHGPLSKGWLHPQSHQLRFRKRDSSAFEGRWESVFREHSNLTRDQWLQAMTEDQVLEDVIQIQRVEWTSAEVEAIRATARARLGSEIVPTRHLSHCFSALHPCEFRFPCAFFSEPEIGSGFVSLPSSSDRTPSARIPAKCI